MSDLMSQSYHDVMEVYKRPMSVRYIPTIFWAFVSVISLSFAFPAMAHANHLPVMYVQVPQWADDWAVCAVDIPDAKCHWYVMAPDNTFGEGFDWETAPWFDANGLNDVAPMQASTVLEELQK
tara:strand:- start:120 stop:488 length:369 start_codon:yes stop_codon:yes gene_type:complete